MPLPLRRKQLPTPLSSSKLCPSGSDTAEAMKDWLECSFSPSGLWRRGGRDCCKLFFPPVSHLRSGYICSPVRQRALDKDKELEGFRRYREIPGTLPLAEDCITTNGQSLHSFACVDMTFLKLSLTMKAMQKQVLPCLGVPE